MGAAGYTFSVEVLGMWSDEADSSNTSSSMPSSIGFIFEDALVPGEISRKTQNEKKYGTLWLNNLKCEHMQHSACNH